MNILDTVNNAEDLKKLNINQLSEYCEEVRKLLVETISKTGGHLASNLGVTEITVALNYVFDVPEDKIIWDVGHQCYVHKIINGRKDSFNSLRTYGGISGFPKTAENEADCFDTGHSSTSVSAALGMIRARELLGKDYKVVSVIGDGALTGGMACEALADAGQKDQGMIVVLNDNQMSISRNVGGLSRQLSNLRSGNVYNRIKRATEKSLSNKKTLWKIAYGFKETVKRLFLKENIFEALGFRYLGPYDGHDIKTLIKIFQRVKNTDENVVIHVITKKGKGYIPAEEKPKRFHGVSCFDVETGEIFSGNSDYSSVFGKHLCTLAENNEKIVAVTAAMPDGTGLTEFRNKFPERYFDVCIAEQHAVTMCAGMAKMGIIPVFAVYSTFLQRAYDQILHDVALQNLHVVFAVDRAGIVGADGATHQGIYDLSYLRTIPNMMVMAPSCYSELEKMLDFAVNKCSGPVAVRYPRGSEEKNIEYKTDIEYGKGEILKDGKDAVIITAGSTVSVALDAASRLDSQGINVAVADMRFVKPIDTELIKQLFDKYSVMVTVEDNISDGGLGEEIALLHSNLNPDCRLKCLSIENVPLNHGKRDILMKNCGLDAENIAKITGDEFLNAKAKA